MAEILNQKSAEMLKDGRIIVAPTDTIYGLLGQALSKKTVGLIYAIKKRSEKKPFIILISSIDDLELFEIDLNEKEHKVLEKIWPGKVSVVLPCEKEDFFYLHRGTKSLAFRLPDDPKLRNFIKETGPLVAPSANPEDFPPAKNIAKAREYFGTKVDCYLDGGDVEGEPSTLVSLKEGEIEILRQGAERNLN